MAKEELDALTVAADLRAFAHEMNNPLAVALGFAQLLILEDGGTERTHSSLERIHSELKRVAATVERLHAYAANLQALCGTAVIHPEVSNALPSEAGRPPSRSPESFPPSAARPGCS